MNIRPYKPDDFEEIAIILKSEEMLDDEWDSRENFDSISVQNKNNILVAEDEQGIIAIVLFLPFGNTAAFGYQLIVKKEYRNRGIANALLDEMIARLKARGVKKIAFDTYADDDFLINFYSKRGFKKSSKNRVVFWKSIS